MWLTTEMQSLPELHNTPLSLSLSLPLPPSLCFTDHYPQYFQYLSLSPILYQRDGLQYIYSMRYSSKKKFPPKRVSFNQMG